jgi:3-deoxy-manno-octulosonate cytidylyltransferase (CMP-KDO synthetase)
MKTIGFIPSRYGSTRLKAKALSIIAGKPMVEWVYTNAKKAKNLDDVIILTDDERIAEVVKNFGGKYEMTDPACNSGTERILSVLDKFVCDIAINIQGDEPLVQSADLDSLVDGLVNSQDAPVATLIRKIKDNALVINPNVVKVVLDNWNNGIYFSRANIPFDRDNSGIVQYFQHIGIYAYKTDVLKKFNSFEGKTLENIEKLEQLRFLENGYKIKTVETENTYISVDIADDLDAVERYLRKSEL